MSEAEMERLGFAPEDFDPEEIWPDNEQAFRLFTAMATQWRVGMAGPTGLDYSALTEVWRRLKIPPADRDELFDDLRVMESAALSKMHEGKQ